MTVTSLLMSAGATATISANRSPNSSTTACTAAAGAGSVPLSSCCGSWATASAVAAAWQNVGGALVVVGSVPPLPFASLHATTITASIDSPAVTTWDRFTASSSPTTYGTAVQTDEIRLNREGPVATIWLDRPAKRNAMTYAMWVGLEEAAANAAVDTEVRVVVLRGAGDHFCAGADITELRAARSTEERSFSAVNMAAEAALASLPKPTIAYIEGDCIGGGCAMAIDCDLRIATTTARLGITPAKLGVVYPSASVERVTHLLGPARTKRLLFTGDLISADEALRMGLVDEVVEGVDGEHRLAELTAVLAERSLLTQAATKAMVAEVMAHGQVSATIRDHWAAIGAAAPDLAEGIAAFRERRPARFTWTGPSAG